MHRYLLPLLLLPLLLVVGCPKDAGWNDCAAGGSAPESTCRNRCERFVERGETSLAPCWCSAHIDVPACAMSADGGVDADISDSSMHDADPVDSNPVDSDPVDSDPVDNDPVDADVGSECTLDTEGSDCPGTSCDPDILACTATALASLGSCEPCRSDSECAQGATIVRRCVAVEHDGETRGGYCLVALGDDASCAAPYNNAVFAVSTGGVEASYCAPREAVTTCEAVLDFSLCMQDSDCGAADVDDSVCRDSGSGGACSANCLMDNDCTGSLRCNLLDGALGYCCTSARSAGCE